MTRPGSGPGVTHSRRGSDVATNRSLLRVWLVNQYALRIDQPGITRHATLAKYMHEHDVLTTIFASNTHYWNVADGAGESADPSAPTFIYTSTSRVESNGVKRVLSMLSFSARTMKAGLLQAKRSGGPPDVVLGSSPHPFAALAAWALAARFRKPFVLEVRDLWPDSLIHLLGLSSRHPLIVILRWIERFLYRRARFVVTLLPGSEARIERIAGRPVQTLWLPNGIDLSRVPAVVPPPDVETFTVMYAGAHGIPNALDTIIEAADILHYGRKDGDSRIRFVLVGDGKEKARLVADAATRGLSNITFRDAVSKSTLLTLLPTADALVITFRATELYQSGISPNKVFDYLAAGRPVIIAVDTPLNPVAEAAAGLTIPPEDPHELADAIRTLARMAVSERSAYGLRGRAYAEANHDLAQSGARLAEALRSTASAS